MTKGNILIVEDDRLVRESLEDVITAADYHVLAVSSGEEALTRLAKHPTDLALIDLRLPRMTGIEVLRHIRSHFPAVDCMMMTSFATVETAVEAMKFGAIEYFTKPINDDELKILISRAFEMRSLRDENRALKNQLADKRKRFHHLVGEDSKMQKIYSVVQAISNTDTTVLLQGESGTGKGMIAQAIHQCDPERRERPYIEVSCGAIPRELLESELFGHVKGAFTSAIRDRVGRFELAEGGTILLDEIDSLPLFLQVKLLRVLQQKTFEMVGDTKTKRANVRIIAATNRDLKTEIVKGNFREDLYYRLNVITIDVPPLRDRRADIPALVTHFISAFSEKTKRSIRGISKDAMQVLTEYDWPGNVRELENTLERVVILSAGEVIHVSDIPDNLHKKERDFPASGLANATSLKEHLKGPERQIILKALEETGWNRKKAAEILDINRTTLYNKMKEHQLL